MKSDLKVTIRTIPMPTDNTYKVISCHKNRNINELFIITGISEIEVDKLKHNQEIKFKRGEFEFNVNPDNVLCYGDIDFHEDSEDCKQLDTFNWLENLDIRGISIPSRYNYDKHECITDRKYFLWTETFRNSTLCRYLHGCLGKPKFTLIFREMK